MYKVDTKIVRINSELKKIFVKFNLKNKKDRNIQIPDKNTADLSPEKIIITNDNDKSK
tara:strand:+ start:407 stop:580 length:174 start_codon:yes stop_codon:yes gene_type:complete